MYTTKKQIKQTYFNFDAGYYVKVLYIYFYEDGTQEYGMFKTDGFGGIGNQYKDKKNFQVALSKTKKQYGEPVVQDDDELRGYDYVSGWGHKYH